MVLIRTPQNSVATVLCCSCLSTNSSDEEVVEEEGEGEEKGNGEDSEIGLPAADLGRLHGGHFLGPSRGGGELADSADFVAGVAGDADVEVALENELHVAEFEVRVGAEFGEGAG